MCMPSLSVQVTHPYPQTEAELRVTSKNLKGATLEWYETVGECEVLLDGSNEIDFWLQLPNSKEAQIEKLTLADLPKRPPRTTRLRIKAQPVSDMEVKIKIKDLGFGEIFKSSDKTWEYMMSLGAVK